MKLLAIDTSSVACSVAFSNDGAVLEEHVEQPRQHTKILMPMIASLLQKGALAVTDLDAIVLGNGPGSFVGMRIGASVAQGLCCGAGVGIIPVSSLAAVALEAMLDSAVQSVAVAQDARMNEVYLGCYVRDSNGLPVAEFDECLCALTELPLSGSSYTAAGGGWERYPDLLLANRNQIKRVVPITVPRARHLLTLAGQSPQIIAPEHLAPAYLRTKVAEKPVT